MSLELKPCPFCGGSAGFMSNAVVFQEVWGVSCDGECGAQIDSCAWDKEDAAEIWNQRSDAARQEGARGGKPVAWSRTDTIRDAEGRGIGMDEPETHYGATPPDDDGGAPWYPMYASPAEPSGWRPIESAPKDGTTIMGWRAGWGPCECRWEVDFDGDECSFAGWVDLNADDETRPTHWVPLPLPPTSEVRPSPAWLIERGDLAPYPVYLRHTRRGHGWTPDHDEATRFPTKAEAISECCGGNESGPLRVVEHMWVSAPTSEGGENA